MYRDKATRLNETSVFVWIRIDPDDVPGLISFRKYHTVSCASMYNDKIIDNPM